MALLFKWLIDALGLWDASLQPSCSGGRGEVSFSSSLAQYLGSWL